MDTSQRVLEMVDAAEAEWQVSDIQVNGVLRVSVPIAFGLDRITPLIPGFLARHPNLSVDMRLTDDREKLIEDQIDVAIRMGALNDSSLFHRRIYGLQRIVVAAPAQLARYGTPLSPSDLEGFPCVAWDGSREHLNRWTFVEAGKETTFRAKGRYRSKQGMSLYQLCLAGVGAMRIAEHLARPAIAEGRLVQILAAQTPQDTKAISAVCLPDRHMVPRIRNFIDFMVEAFQVPDWE
jgi:DNA-binding transcriptional LysR family regulator